ncbi:helix-turn-helix transcriptional regulator [Streptomyces sp. NPDC004732]|uniref:helix-turn-helix domain-containing protein n=1 Tax=Streptomyces sp. NPDC004732 TaxID=3154290 RepID=UPI0033B8FD10
MRRNCTANDTRSVAGLLSGAGSFMDATRAAYRAVRGNLRISPYGAPVPDCRTGMNSTRSTDSAAPTAPAGPIGPAPLPDAADRRHLRERWGLTPQQLASAFGVTAETVRSWESGRTSPRGERRRAYALFLAGLAQRTAPAHPPRADRPVPGVVRVVAVRPGAAPMTTGRPVRGEPDPVCPRRLRRLRVVAAGVGLWSIFVHLMVTSPVPPL